VRGVERPSGVMGSDPALRVVGMTFKHAEQNLSAFLTLCMRYAG